MAAPSFDLPQAHRWFAVECNNTAWDLLEKPSRTPAESDAMLHAAHAACFHWAAVGTAVHRMRAMVLLANVYAELGDARLCAAYARECYVLALEQPEGFAAWDLAFALEAVARADALQGNLEAARAKRQDVTQLAQGLETEDRQLVERSLASRNWYGAV